MTSRHPTFVTGVSDLSAGVTTDAADLTFQMDEDAFRGFYDRTSRMLWAYLARMAGDRQLADDLLQECYYRFLRVETVLETESHRRHYLFRIATNLVRDSVRRRRTTVPSISQELAPEAMGDPGHVEGLNRRLDVTRAMDRLKPRERAMLWLAYAQGASHEEIARMVGVRPSSMKAMLSRARRKLAVALGGGPAS
ncbi:MAG TPA: sigma-70 family RNA polymerase sigma factor [Vicinamibacterales bacterium]|nr:sigma-70 family RNA polymerase sigma factor [Vicinamibacterales bacterium]